MWKSLLLTGLLLGSAGCAARQKSAEEAAREASYRVVLVNQTGSQLKYHYSRYISPEAQRNQMMPDQQHNPSTSLSFGIAFAELDAGNSTFLDVLPSTSVTVVFMQNGQQKQQEILIDKGMTLTVGAQGPQQGPLPSISP